MTVCHARTCEREATLRMRLGNNFSFKDRWTSGLDYCDEDAEKVGLAMADRGLRVLLEPLGQDHD